MSSSRPRGSALAVPTLVGLLAGCGLGGGGGDGRESGKDARAILTDAAAALRSAAGAHLSGDIRVGRSHVALDLDIANRRALAGNLVIDGVPVAVASSGGNSYLAGEGFWRQEDPHGRSATLFGDRCVLLPPNFPGAASLFSTFGQLGDLAGVAGSLAGLRGPITKGPQSVLAGRGVVSIRGADTTVLVATQGPPYPLRIDTTGPDPGRLDLAFGSGIRPVLPTGCIDATRLGALAVATPSPAPQPASAPVPGTATPAPSP